MRGIVSVHAVKGRSYKRFLTAEALREKLEEEIADQIAVARGEPDLE
jgi:hypothetical protein